MATASFLVLSVTLLATSKTMTWALVTPIDRRTVGNRMTRLQTRPSNFRLNMSSLKTKTLLRHDGELTEEEDVAIDVLVNSPENSIAANENKDSVAALIAATSTTIIGLTVISEAANALSVPGISIPSVPLPVITMPKELTQTFDPSQFTPVCAASDSFYRVLQNTAMVVVGREKFVEYGPLIASGLLRVRLELCVVESFFNEAVGPFISQNGLSWVLPVHETVETFLAGSVFALATTFILVGSTKLLTVIFTYVDFFVGGPFRLFGGFFFDRARGKPVTLDVGLGPFKTRVIGPKDDDMSESDKRKGRYDFAVNFSEMNPAQLPVVLVSGGCKFVGQSVRIVREILDAIDLFVGKSLVLWMTAYIGIKFLHFKVFPDFP